MHVSREAEQIYQMFRKQSSYVVALANVQAIIDICKEFQPKRVLDIGGGCGTSSYTFLTYSDCYIDIYEPIPYCIQKMKQNLNDFYGRYSVMPSYDILPSFKHYDVIFVDGGGGKRDDRGYPKFIYDVIDKQYDLQVVYFEGYRTLQRIWARKALKKRYLYTLRYYQPANIGEKAKRKGGLAIICQKEKSKIKKFINYYYWEVREWKLIKYWFKYRIKWIRSKINN